MDEQQISSYNPRLEKSGFVLAIVSIFTCFLLYLSIPFGAMAIILTLLSRGTGRLRPRARLAVIIAAGTITASSCMTGFYAWRIMSDPRLKEQFMNAIEYYSDFYLGTSQTEQMLPEGGDQA